MSKLTAREIYEERKRSLRFAHASMRLRDRYGIELTEELYSQINSRFINGHVQGAIRNRRGDIEAWVKVNDQLIPAVFSTSERVVVTFFAKPPSLPTHEPSPAVTVIHEKPTEEQVVKAAQAMFIEWVNKERSRKPGMGERLQAAVQQAARVAADFRWIKDQCRNAASMIRRGETEQANSMLEAICALPAGISPSRDTARAEAAIAELMERNRAFFADRNEAMP